MTDTLTPVLTDNWDADRAWTLAAYEDRGGYAALQHGARAWRRTTVIEAVKDSGLRGRGGAGFPTGMKWGFIPQDNPKPKYLVVNADESEPGTCKDIPLMMASPHTLVEGVIISSYAIRANTRVHLRARRGAARRTPAAARRPGGLPRRATSARTSTAPATTSTLVVHAGAGAYICGEETALLDSPRGPPRPTAAAPAVPRGRRSLRQPDGDQQRRVDRVGAEHHRPTAPTGSPRWAPRSPRASASSRCPGHVTRPGQYEAPLGITLRAADRPRRRHARGPRAEVLDARRVQHAAADRRAPRRARSTSRASARPARCSAPARCRSSTRPPAWCARCCAGPSSTSTSPAASARRAARAPGGWCRRWPRLEKGQGSEADLELLLDQCDNILGRSFCALGRRRGQPDHAARSSTSATSTSRTSTARRLPVRPGRLDRLRDRGSARMTVSTGTTTAAETVTSDLVTLTIDGVEVSVPKDTLVIRAAEQVGVQIPRFCDHPLLDAGRRLPPVPGRHPRRRQRPRLPEAAGLLHARRSPRAWSSTPRPPRRSPTRRSRGSWSSC